MRLIFSNHIANCTNFRCYIQPKPDFILPKNGIFLGLANRIFIFIVLRYYSIFLFERSRKIAWF